MRWRVHILVTGFCGGHEKDRIEAMLADAPDVAEHNVALRQSGTELGVVFSTKVVFVEDAISRAQAVVQGLRQRELDIQMRVRPIHDQRSEREPRSSSAIPAGQRASPSLELVASSTA